MEGDGRVRILVADDHPMLREGLVAVLCTQPDFEVVGEATTGTETVNLAVGLEPDVILLDLEMPELDGVEVLERLRKDGVETRAVVFTAYDTDERILGALRAGARGYLLKGASRREIFEAIRVIYSGGSLLQPVVTSRLLRRISQDDRREAFEPLTPRELEVLALVASGRKNAEIARQLFISERTVKFHVSSIMQKLGAENRTKAVTLAAQHGLIHLTN